MPIRKVKTCVQLHGRARAGNVNGIQRIVEDLDYHPDFNPNNIIPGAKPPVKKPDTGRKPKKKQARFTLCASSSNSSDEAIYDDTDEETEEPEQLVIKKQPVISLEEQKSKGLFSSGLGGAIVNSNVPPSELKSFPSIEEDSAEDPSASLIIDIPVYVPEGEELLEIQSAPAQEQSEQAQSAPVISPSPRSSLQILVELFAGRKKPVSFKQFKKRRDDEPIFDESGYGDGFEDEAQATSDRSSYISAEPRLTLPQVIPGRQYRVTDLVPRTHVNISPPRREHRYTGYAIIQPDQFTPEKTTRGFNTTQVGASLTPPIRSPLAPLAYRAHKQGNSAAKLLDRDTRTWAGWHDKNPLPDKMPFAKQPSTANLKETYCESTHHLNQGHPVSCYLQHTGDAYPYAHNKCW